MPQSPNKATISSLIQTLQQKGWIEKKEPAKLYDALLKMNEDLNKVYDTLFFGPLPPVNANALTHLNALNIDGIIPEANLPANIAFQDRENLFNDLNSFINEDEASIALGFGSLNSVDRSYIDEPTSWFRMGSKSDGDFFISQNYNWDGASFTLDDVLISGSIIEFVDGAMVFSWLAPADAFSYPTTHLEETFTIHGKRIDCKDYLQDSDDLNILLVDQYDIIFLADEAGSYTDLFRGHLAIPNKADTKLPAIDGAFPNRLDGIICINKTNHNLVYYSAGARYKLNGTVF